MTDGFRLQRTCFKVGADSSGEGQEKGDRVSAVPDAIDCALCVYTPERL
jgi:hypothetical protein